MYLMDPRHVNNVVLVELGHEPNEPIVQKIEERPETDIGVHVDPNFTAVNRAALEELGHIE
ncbi:MAG: hypothetical protein ABII02_03165 [Candidatus Magasanikbacteria bacterium]